MGTVKSHLAAMHESAAADFVAKGKHHSAMAKCFSKLADGSADAGETFSTMARLHKTMATHCAEQAENHLNHAKELSAAAKVEGDDLGKRGDALVPSPIHAIMPGYPGLRAVQRPGGPPIPAAPGSDIIDKALSGIDID